jgi:hypothetical protein
MAANVGGSDGLISNSRLARTRLRPSDTAAIVKPGARASAARP